MFSILLQLVKDKGNSKEYMPAKRDFPHWNKIEEAVENNWSII